MFLTWILRIDIIDEVRKDLRLCEVRRRNHDV